MWMDWEDFGAWLRSAPGRFSPWCLEQVDQLKSIHFAPPTPT